MFNLPCEIQDIILQCKHDIETATFEDFVSSFSMKVMSRGEVMTKVLLHYKPTNKYMFATYERVNMNDNNITVTSVIDNLLHNTHAMLEECENATDIGQSLKWNCTISYYQYCANNNTNLMADLTLQEFCEWRKEYLQLKKVLGPERFNKLICLTKED